MANCVTIDCRLRFLAALLCAVVPCRGSAQVAGPDTATTENEAPFTAETGGLTTLGSVAESRLRLNQILGRADAGGFLLRSASDLSPRPEGSGASLLALFAGMESSWNSALPFSQNDGSMWAGRGLSMQITAGMRFDAGPVSLILAPKVTYQQNLAYQIFPFNRMVDDGRDPFSSPWYDRPESIDLPSRFGSNSFGTADLGQSSLSVSWGPLAIGAATENLWWGPGIRNAIIMSDHAAGIPHLFLRTGDGVVTPIGEIEARWMVGRLEESDHFDNIEVNDTRSISAVAIALRPAFEPNLAVGFARAVYAPTSRNRLSAAAAFDVFKDVGRPNARPRSDLGREPGADQLFSLFGRWLFPAAGLEAYGEWARYEQPGSLRDFLVLPQHSQGYTLGLQWARSVADSAIVRLQGEVTYLEPSSSFRQRNEIGWYTSRPVRQGYTHRGQVVGASIGPGASSQFLAADFLPSGDSQVGLFAGRIRWNNHAFYAASPLRPFFAHDVSLYAGVRGSHRVGPLDVAVELSTEGRMNYLFQSPSPDWEAQEAVDIRNHSLRLSITRGAN
jgi:hypothetical protein